MKTGRNGACPCGSGKKYKKCCLGKENAIDALWNKFSTQDYEDRIVLFQKALNERDLMDSDMAMEMLGKLYSQSIEKNEQERFDALVEKLRERLPDVYSIQNGTESCWLEKASLKV